jgi:hypothetical protein
VHKIQAKTNVTAARPVAACKSEEGGKKKAKIAALKARIEALERKV